jgi:Uma2 family endonuclease
MGTASTLMSVEEYLKYSGKPNCEYIDGVLRPKSMPTSLHGLIELLLALLLRSQGVDARPEVTVRLTPTRYLVPDVIADPMIEDPYPTKPVMLCVEVLSPDDRPGAALAKCEEYHTWGVPYCWVIDPIKRTAWEYYNQGDPAKIEAGGTLHAGNLVVQLANLFSPPATLS